MHVEFLHITPCFSCQLKIRKFLFRAIKTLVSNLVFFMITLYIRSLKSNHQSILECEIYVSSKIPTME